MTEDFASSDRKRLVDLTNLVLRNSRLLKDAEVEDLLQRYDLPYNQPTVAEYRLISIIAAAERLLLDRPAPPDRPAPFGDRQERIA